MHRSRDPYSVARAPGDSSEPLQAEPLRQAQFQGGPPPSPYHDAPRPGGVRASLREAFQILRRQKLLIALVALGVLILVGAYVLTSESEYSAYTVLMVENMQSDDQDNALSSGLIEALGQGNRNATNQTLLLRQSFAIAEGTVQRLREARGEIEGPVTVLQSDGEEEPTLTQLVRRLPSYVSISSAEESSSSDAVRITGTSTNPHEAAFIANAYAEEYVEQAEKMSRARIGSSRTFLERQLAERGQELRALEDSIQQYMSRQGASGLETETKSTIEQRAQLEARLDEARVEERRAEAALASVEEELDEIRPQLSARVSSGVEKEIGQTQDKIAQLEAQLEQIYIRNPELRDNPAQSQDVADLTNRIDQLKARADELSNRYVDEIMAVGGTDPLKTEGNSSMTYVAKLKQQAVQERIALRSAEARIRALRQRMAQYDQRLQNIPEQSIRLAQLQRDQRSTEELYTNLEKKMQEVRMADGARIQTAEIIRPALVSFDPMQPSRLLLLMGVLLGLALGVVAGVVRHVLDDRVYTPHDLDEHNFISLGTIPDMNRIEGGQSVTGAQKNGGATGAAAKGVGTVLGVPQGGSTAISEAYRRLHLSVQFSQPGRAVQTVLVTSPEPGAGKSTTVLNLAATAARSGRRTLVVDADLRRPQIYTLLDRRSGPFLSELLTAETLEPERLATTIDNLYAVTVREPLADADVVLSSGEMARLISRMREAFDLILFDSPPVMAVADATSLSSHCDATLIVAGAGQTNLEALGQTSDELYEAQATVAGVVLNRYDPSKDTSAQYYHYRYQDYGYDAAT